MVLLGGGGYYYYTKSGTPEPGNMQFLDGYFLANGLIHPPEKPEESLKMIDVYVKANEGYNYPPTYPTPPTYPYPTPTLPPWTPPSNFP